MRPKVARMAGIFIGAVPGASVASRWRDAHLHRVLAGVPRYVRYWFTLVDPVDRRAYLATGLGLMAFKYAVDAGAVALATGRFWSPLDYLLPFYLLRAEKLAGAPAWFLPAFVLWTLPFLWIGVAMTLRRAVDAGRSPWLALAFFVPLVNYVVMLALCRLPTVPLNPREERAGGREVDARPALVLYGIAAGLAVALPTILLNVYVLRRYSTSLFLGTPFTLGAVTAYVFNRAAPQGSGATAQVVSLSLLLLAGAILLFALEGLFCVALAMPLALALASPTEALFRLGIAYPIRARIDGVGAGAIRRCEFSTGTFVEPISAWEAPARLSFDITAQPVPLRELSPYGTIAPPHLQGYFRARRGAFRLTALPGGRTLLVGATWYELDIEPRRYWKVPANAIVSAIHRRVLLHIKRL